MIWLSASTSQVDCSCAQETNGNSAAKKISAAMAGKFLIRARPIKQNETELPREFSSARHKDLPQRHRVTEEKSLCRFSLCLCGQFNYLLCGQNANATAARMQTNAAKWFQRNFSWK